MNGDQQQRQGTPTQTTQQQQQQMIPKHRFDEVLNRLRALEDQNLQLRSTLDTVYTKQQAQQPTQTEDSPFEPTTRKAIHQEFQRLLEVEKQKLQGQLGYLHDQNDALHFELKYGQKYGGYVDRIERLRQQKLGQGTFISREDALKLIVFEDTGRKPHPQAQKQVTTKLDPYTQTVVEEEVSAQPEGVDVPDVDLNDFQPQTTQTQQPQQRMQEPDLPPAAITSGAPVQRAPATAPRLSLETDEKALAAWEDKYGNVTF